jgi:hypothetical protein
MFGASRAEKMLYLLIAYDLNTSPLRNADADTPSDAELDAFIEALDLTPPYLQQIRINKKMSRVQRGLSEGMTLANASMEFFDLWSNETAPKRIYAVVHELSHNWATSLDYKNWDENPLWLSIGGWQKNGTAWITKKPQGSISVYASKNPSEDFAESSAAYRFNPRALKRVSPERYEFMRKIIYGGLEFDTKNLNCSKPAPFVQALEKEFTRIANSKDEINRAMAGVFRSCAKPLSKALISQQERQSFRICLSAQLTTKAVNSVLGQELPFLPRWAISPLTNGTAQAPEESVTVALEAAASILQPYCELWHTPTRGSLVRAQGIVPIQTLAERMRKNQLLPPDEQEAYLAAFGLRDALARLCLP